MATPRIRVSGPPSPTLPRAFADLGVDGIVIGFARDGQPQIEHVIDVVPAAVSVTFHRAFDQLADPCGAIARLAAVRADRSDPDERRRRQPDWRAANGFTNTRNSPARA